MKKVTPTDIELSRRERQILETLYRLGKATAAEIRDALSNPPTYTAIRTHLTNLESKGQVSFKSVGPRYVYEPTVPRQKMAGKAMGEIIRTFFDNNVDLVVATLIDQKEPKLSSEQLERLAALIEQAQKEGR